MAMLGTETKPGGEDAATGRVIAASRERLEDGDGPPTFARVLEEELGLIRVRRRAVEGDSPPGGGQEQAPAAVNDDKRMMAARVAVLDEHVTGLSFSGGGIRSGTFAVGFLQGLGMLGLLKRFDYL